MMNRSRIEKFFKLELTDREYELDGQMLHYLAVQGEKCAQCGGFDKCTNMAKHQQMILRRDRFGNLVKAFRNCNVLERHIRQQKMARLFDQAQVPEKMRGMTFANYKVNPANKATFDVVCRFANTENPSKGILVSGPCGIGKTHLGWAVLQERLKRGDSCLGLTVIDLLRTIKQTFDGDKEKAEELMKAIYTVDYLLLDDMGAEQAKDWSINHIFSILDNRLANKKVNIITTNFLNLKEMADKMCDGSAYMAARIYSRIAGGCVVLDYTDTDHRIKAG